MHTTMAGDAITAGQTIMAGWQGGPPCGGFPLLPLLLLFGAAVAALYWWKQKGGRGPFRAKTESGRPSGSSATSAEDLLTERFARGDIDDEEYWQRLSVIRESQRGDGGDKRR